MKKEEEVLQHQHYPIGKLVEIVCNINVGDEAAIHPTEELDEEVVHKRLLSQIELEKVLNEKGKDD